MLRRLAFAILWLTVGAAHAQLPQTPAEKVDFQQRGTLYTPMMEYVYDLDARSELLQVQKIAKTLLDRDIVVAIMSDPPVYQPGDLANSDRPVVLIVNNVHGGEYAGKDATLMLMRDLVLGELKPLLKKVVVLIVPTINPDGAEVYRRTNEQGFDLNRDYIKLESQEIHGLVTQVINRWHPDIHVDTHHGGSAPYTLTYQTCLNPACDPDLVALGNNVIIPRIQAALRNENYDGFWYSGPSRLDGQEGWAPTSCEPRKQHTYSGLSNMVGFLFETPSGTHRATNNGAEVVVVDSNDRYQHQVRGQYIGQRELIRFAAEEAARLRQTIEQAKLRAVELGSNDSDNDPIILEYKQESKGNEQFWRAQGWGTRQPRDAQASVQFERVNLPVFTKFSTTRTTVRPWGYLLPPNLAPVVPLLLDHEIAVQRTAEPMELEVEVYYATEARHKEYFQGHYLVGTKVDKKVEKVQLPAGSFFIPCGQAKANLISYLMEPETDDNLITWNFLDNYVVVQSPELRQSSEDMPERMARQPREQRIPIYRVTKKTAIKGVLLPVGK